MGEGVGLQKGLALDCDRRAVGSRIQLHKQPVPCQCSCIDSSRLDWKEEPARLPAAVHMHMADTRWLPLHCPLAHQYASCCRDTVLHLQHTADKKCLLCMTQEAESPAMLAVVHLCRSLEQLQAWGRHTKQGLSIPYLEQDTCHWQQQQQAAGMHCTAH